MQFFALSLSPTVILTSFCGAVPETSFDNRDFIRTFRQIQRRHILSFTKVSDRASTEDLVIIPHFAYVPWNKLQIYIFVRRHRNARPISVRNS